MNYNISTLGIVESRALGMQVTAQAISLPQFMGRLTAITQVVRVGKLEGHLVVVIILV